MTQTSVQLTTLQDTTRRAIDKFPAERARIERGAMIVALGQLARTGPDTFGVKSRTRPDTYYAVTVDPAAFWATDCPCEDARRHPGQQCMHQWAATILMVAEERQRRLDVRERFAALSAEERRRLAAWKRRYEATPA